MKEQEKHQEEENPQEQEKQNYKPGFLLGKWEVDGICRYVREESKWEYLDQYDPGFMIWEFTDDTNLSCCRNGQRHYDTKYLYREKSRELLISLSYLKTPSYRNLKFLDTYRVDVKSPEEIWLHLLDDAVIREPQDYWLATKLIRRR